MDDIIPSRAPGNPLSLEVVDIAYGMLKSLCLYKQMGSVIKLNFGRFLF